MNEDGSDYALSYDLYTGVYNVTSKLKMYDMDARSFEGITLSHVDKASDESLDLKILYDSLLSNVSVLIDTISKTHVIYEDSLPVLMDNILNVTCPIDRAQDNDPSISQTECVSKGLCVCGMSDVITEVQKAIEISTENSKYIKKLNGISDLIKMQYLPEDIPVLCEEPTNPPYRGKL